ncbi:MAG: tail fiber domain-containing protein [Planctomycetaceae bacterium]|nr:tail fiber domain-containing protein [Planctomycetaceae bacterium]
MQLTYRSPFQSALTVLAGVLGIAMGDGSHAADLTASSTEPALSFDDTNGAAGAEWSVHTQNDGAVFNILDISRGQNVVRIDRGARHSSLHIGPADGGGNPNVGIGGIPDADMNLHIIALSLPKIRLEQISDSFPFDTQSTWDVEASTAGFVIRDADGLGNIGLGTSTPQFPLHVVRTSDTGTLARFQQTRPNKAVLVGFQNDAPASLFNSCGFDYLLNDAVGSKIVSRISCSMVDTTANAGTAAFQFQVMNNGVTGQAMKIQGNRVSIGTNASTDLLRVLNATCNGATWNNACSRELKQDIAELNAAEAHETLAALKPVTYAYKHEPDESRVGFIAEDVPQRVALADGKSLSSMDIVAVLTKVTQDQEQTIEAQADAIVQLQTENVELRARLDRIEAMLAE